MWAVRKRPGANRVESWVRRGATTMVVSMWRGATTMVVSMWRGATMTMWMTSTDRLLLTRPKGSGVLLRTKTTNARVVFLLSFLNKLP